MSSNAPTPDVTSPEPAAPNCGSGNEYNGRLELRISAAFVILITSLLGTLFPIVAKRWKTLKVPVAIFDFAKYFGSGVIIATAFIHLLAPAWDALTSDCLTGAWKEYDWAPAIAMMSVFAVFLLEFFTFRFGMARLAKLGIAVDPHAGALGGDHDSHGPEGHLRSRAVDCESGAGLAGTGEGCPAVAPFRGAGYNKHDTCDTTSPSHLPTEKKSSPSPSALSSQLDLSPRVGGDSAAAQILGVAILEFGIIFHSVIIGLTLAVDPGFTTLFAVIVFHQMFEGLGLGARLAYLPLASSLHWVPYVAGIVYAFVTPIGVAIGLGVRTTYNPESATASIVSGVLDATSAGILLYTGLVELLAHEFIFNKAFLTAPMSKVVYSLSCVCLGAGIMALLGRWA